MSRWSTLILACLALLSLIMWSCTKDDENLPPGVAFQSPASGSTIAIDSLVVVRIRATDDDGRIAYLRLYLGSTLLREVESSDLTYVWDTEGLGAGSYRLKAEAVDEEGAQGSASMDLVLTGNFAPLAEFSFSPSTVMPNQAVAFDASASSDPEDPLSALRFRWDWEGDGQWDLGWSADPMATHTYALPGAYWVNLEVKDSKGLVGRDSALVTVGGVPPVAAFTLNPSSGTTAVTFLANAGASYDPDGSLSDLRFRWDWDGDGSWDTPFQSDTLGAQKYASVGTYRIRLQVRDADQLTDTVSKTLTVLPVAAGFQPCPGLPAVVYAGKQYTTVKIGSQCWLRENLDVGTMVSTATGQTGNAVMEKYCYENQSSNCQIFGGLYTWDEAMKYASSPQGICPLGWHIPSDAEWKLLEGHVDSQYDSLSGIWDSLGFRGYDAGRQLRSGSTWSAGGSNPDLYGFTALAGGGAYGASANFAALGTSAMLWTSEATGASDAMARYLDAGDDRSYRGGFQKVNAFSVRCIRD